MAFIAFDGFSYICDQFLLHLRALLHLCGQFILHLWFQETFNSQPTEILDQLKFIISKNCFILDHSIFQLQDNKFFLLNFRISYKKS